MSDRNEKGRFIKGHPGGPGRRVGAGPYQRIKALVLSIFIENQDEFEKIMRERAKKDVLKYYREFVEGLLGTETNISVDLMREYNLISDNEDEHSISEKLAKLQKTIDEVNQSKKHVSKRTTNNK